MNSRRHSNRFYPYRLAAVVFGIALLLAGLPVFADENKPAEDHAVLNPADWKVTFPIANDGGKALEVLNPDFTTYMTRPEGFPEKLRPYVYRTDEGLVFYTAYTGVTTSSRTSYSRTELREMTGDKQHNWTLKQGGKLHCRLKIADLKGGAKKIIFMQIHGKAPNSKPLLKCIWDKGKIRLLTKNGSAIKDFELKKQYDLVPLNKWFTCTINASAEALTISINGKEIETFTDAEVLSDWPSDNTYYFKAGNYLQEKTEGKASTVVFSDIDVSHE